MKYQLVQGLNDDEGIYAITWEFKNKYRVIRDTVKTSLTATLDAIINGNYEYTKTRRIDEYNVLFEFDDIEELSEKYPEYLI